MKQSEGLNVPPERTIRRHERSARPNGSPERPVPVGTKSSARNDRNETIRSELTNPIATVTQSGTSLTDLLTHYTHAMSGVLRGG